MELLVWFCCAIAALGVFLLLWTYIESQLRQINHHRVFIQKKSSRPLRILHLSDIHFSGPDVRLGCFFDRLASEEFDFIFISGDIFDCEAGAEAGSKNLSKLRAKHGVFAVFGNHDYYDYRLTDIAFMGFRGRRHPDTIQPVEKFENALKDAGVKLLRNEAVRLRVDGVPITIHGLDDPTTGRADIERAMHLYDPEPINILLSHTVDAFFYIGDDEIDISFSGHSHGGQIRFPWVGPLITHTQLGPAFAAGIHSLKGAVCSISRGVAASRFFFLRLLCRPEAIILEVHSKA